jgi:hypothetical protein
MSTQASQIKSKDRVRELAEVYTAEREVNAMLDLLGPVNANITATYLEPACGNGNFLVAILGRKLDVILQLKGAKQAEIEFKILQAASAIHGIDICSENVTDARIRMRADVSDFYSEHFNTWKATPGFYDALDLILETNIQVGDMLNGTADLIITEWKAPKRLNLSRATFRMDDMLRTGGGAKSPLKPIERMPSKHYQKLAS